MTKRRVVITGAGIVSCIGNDLDTVETSLREGRTGIKAMPKFTELGMRSQVAGVPEIDVEARIDRKQLRFLGDAAPMRRSRWKMPSPRPAWLPSRSAIRVPA